VVSSVDATEVCGDKWRTTMASQAAVVPTTTYRARPHPEGRAGHAGRAAAAVSADIADVDRDGRLLVLEVNHRVEFAGLPIVEHYWNGRNNELGCCADAG
jgi:hypothetical protein